MSFKKNLYLSNLVSYCFGKIAFAQFPFLLRLPILFAFKLFLRLNLSEAIAPLHTYKSINDLFIRKLQTKYRPWNKSDSVLCSPADGKIAGVISVQNNYFTIKNVTYSLADLVGQEENVAAEITKLINIYLSPQDCHHVYSPCDLIIDKVSYLPGKLLPVHALMLKLFPKLYASNERLVLHAHNNNQTFILVLVGALNVGHMTLACSEPGFSTNNLKGSATNTLPLYKKSFKKGDLLGTFNLGSTVLLFLNDNDYDITDFSKNAHICYGQSIATLKEK